MEGGGGGGKVKKGGRRCRDEHLSMNTFESPVSDLESSQGSSQVPQYVNFNAPGPSDTACPTSVIPTVGGSVSGSGHSSGSKRSRSPQGTNPPPIRTSFSGGRRRRSEPAQNALAELVELGKQQLALAREVYEYEKSTHISIPTISTCMTRFRQLPGSTPAKQMLATKAFKDPSERDAFMSMTDELALIWLDELGA